MVNLITSADNATPGAGTILNQCALTFNSFAQLAKEQQEHAGTVTAGSLGVQYGYDSGAGSSNQIRLNAVTYPNGRTIIYSFGATGGMDDRLNRVTAIQDSSGTLAAYVYLGIGTVIRINYPQPQVWLDLWGGSTGVFSGLDQFNRIIDQRWQNYATATDLDRYQYGYDQNSNRLYKANVVGTPIVTGGLDEFYTMDPLNRLTDMQRGVLNGTKTGITGTPAREQAWTLDATGNWSGFVDKVNGTTDLNQTRTTNTVNEITNITESVGPTWVVPAYDAAGNTTTFPQAANPTLGFTAVYDGWNRMVSVNAGGMLVGKYAYDGRNRRFLKLIYISGVLSETRHLFYTNGWQNIEERLGSSLSMDKQYVWGIRYIDELACRDAAGASSSRSSSSSSSSSDSSSRSGSSSGPSRSSFSGGRSTLRLYAMQDANFNLTAICGTAGVVAERYVFDPYGNRSILSPAWSTIGASNFRWVVGHQGLMHDEEGGLVHNRKRYLLTVLGGFLSRDTPNYTDWGSLYVALHSNPGVMLDPFGLDAFGPPFVRASTKPIKNPVGPSAGIGYVFTGINEYQSQFKDCWLYKATGLDKLFAKLTAGAYLSTTSITTLPTATGGFIGGNYQIPPAGWGIDTAVHESVHAFNYWAGYHEGNAGELDDEGMAWAVQDILQVAQNLCLKFVCDDCAHAQKIWDSTWRSMDQVIGSAAGTTNNPGNITRTNVWDVNFKLNLLFSESALRPLFEQALLSRNLHCQIRSAPMAGGTDAKAQLNPFK